MCFYNDDYDWIAEYNEQEFVRGDKPATCHECRRAIAPGEWRMEAEQQENEMCQLCEDDCSYDYLDGVDVDDDAAIAAFKANCKHDYGESFSCAICRECCKILAAIYDLERIEGCPEHARQPGYGELAEAMNEYQDGAKYIQHAVALFPELATHEFCAAPSPEVQRGK